MFSLRAFVVLVCVLLLGSSASALPLHVSFRNPAPAPPSAVIDFPQPVSPAFAGTSVVLTAASSNGTPVSYTVISGPGTIPSGSSTLTYTGVGTVVVEANQNTATDPPTPVQRTIVSQMLNQPLTVASAPISTVVTFQQAGTVGAIRAASQGAAYLDFVLSPGGTCTEGTSYNAGDTCIASFIFTPQRPGLRFGGIVVSDASGNLLANAYVVGEGTGPQILYNPPNQMNVGAGFGGLSGVAVDGSGNVYASDIVGGGVYQVSPAGVTRQIATTPNTTDVFVDGSGNVFYADRQSVYEILAVNGIIPQTPTIRTLATSFLTIDGIKVDAYGNVYVAEASNSPTTSSIAELVAVNGVIPSPTTPRVVASPVGSPTGVAVDINNNVYYSDENDHTLDQIQATNGVITNPHITVISSALSIPTNVAIDVSGNVYVPDNGTHNVRELLAVNGVLPTTPTIIDRGQNLSSPQGAAVDASGNLYVADSSLGSVVELAYGAPPTLTFAATQIGQTSSDSPKTVSITNGGNADLVSPAPAAGTNPFITQSFTIDPSTTCPVLTPGSAAGTLPQGASCNTAIDFTPATQGPITGQLVSTDDNQGVTNATQIILLNGVGLAIPPTIVFSVPDHTFGDPPFTVAATSNSTGAFTYSVVNGPAIVSGATVTLTGAGTIVLRATEAAAGQYGAGTADAAFQVNRAAQTITFTPPPSPIPYNNPPILLRATASSGLPVTFSILSGPAQVSGNVLTVTGGGVVVVAADQAGNTYYLPAPQVRQTIVVTFGPAAATLAATPTSVFLTNPVQLTAVVTGGGGSPTGIVQFVEGNTVLGSAVIASGSATASTAALSLGRHNVVAVYQGDRNFASVQSASVTVLVEDFQLTLANPNVQIDHGGTATYSFSVVPIGGATMPADIQLTMQGGPQYSTSAFAPSVVHAGSGTTPVALSIHTPNFPSGQASFTGASSVGLRLAGLTIGVLGIGLWRKRKRFPRGWTMTVILLLAGAACTSLSGCGSGWRAQYWTVNVTATSGNLSHTASGTLISRCANGSDACSIR